MSEPVTYASAHEWSAKTALPSSGGRSPAFWTPLGQTTLGDEWTQIAGPKMGRVTIVIRNTGANDVHLAERAKPTSYTILPSLASISLDMEAEVWASSPLGSETDTFETWFYVGGPFGSDTGAMPSLVPAL